MKISSWGRLSNFEHNVAQLHDSYQVASQLKAHNPGIAYGMGRSYGDICLNPEGVLWKTTGLNHLINFNDETGVLICEAGVLLRDIQQLLVQHGWILPVTPGTQLITVGGAIANDVHGKNHHLLGSFGDHVKQIKLVRTDGTVIECSPDVLPEWFAATVGGMGLTGVITEVVIQLRKVSNAWIDTETIPFFQLEEFFSLSDNSEAGWEHAVSWIDCLSQKGGGLKGLFMRGNPAKLNINKPTPKSKKMTMPFIPPISLVNKLSLHPFNVFYFNLKKWQAGKEVVHYEPFFYPLDNLLEWNRMYGTKGFYQYQSVVPREVGYEAIQVMLKEISNSGEGSFLAVLKTFGNRNGLGMMSFPRPGVTLALDFPNRGYKTLKLLDRLDAIVREAKGRIYLAKDARMPRDLFEQGYPNLTKFLRFRDPGISSAMSRRLIGD